MGVRIPEETSWTQGQMGPQVTRPRGQGKKEAEAQGACR